MASEGSRKLFWLGHRWGRGVWRDPGPHRSPISILLVLPILCVVGVVVLKCMRDKLWISLVLMFREHKKTNF